jgi:tetratricopeptide (TPR) repeat protein
MKKKNDLNYGKKAYINRGNSYAALNQHGQAIKDYDRAIEIDPADKDAYTNRGNSHTVLGQHVRAIKDYDKAIEIVKEIE